MYRNIRKFLGENRLRDEEGGIGIFGLYIFATSAILAGVAIDYGNLVSAKTQLQATTDAVAHAALVLRDQESADDARVGALELASLNMPATQYGDIIRSADIEFGTFDTETGEFTVDEASRSAVRVIAARADSHSNPVGSFLLQMAGLNKWDVVTQAVFTTYRPTCFREGFVAEGVVDIQSGNGFSNGFCIHSNDHVSLNSSNTFQAGSIVSMPNTTSIDLPNSGFESNEGLEAALREGAYRMRIVNRIPDIISGISTLNREYLPSYITGTHIKYINNARKISQADLTPGFVHVVGCRGGRLTVEGAALQNVAIVTDCEVKFDNGVSLEQVLFVTTNSGLNSFNSPSGLTVGLNDNCADGGGSQLVTLGGMNFASSLNMYGSQLLARNNIDFAANANGIMGASMVSGGRIQGTSNMNMGFCGRGMTNIYEAEYFRLAL